LGELQGFFQNGDEWLSNSKGAGTLKSDSKGGSSCPNLNAGKARTQQHGGVKDPGGREWDTAQPKSVKQDGKPAEVDWESQKKTQKKPSTRREHGPGKGRNRLGKSKAVKNRENGRKSGKEPYRLQCAMPGRKDRKKKQTTKKRKKHW